MKPLSQMQCEACRRGAPTAAPEEIAEFMPQLPDWRIVERDGVERLERAFSFPDFAQALAFANRVGELAEAQQHHPRIVLEWGCVSVAWWTHKIRGLHKNDFIMALRTDQAFAAK